MTYSFITPEELRSYALPVTDAQWDKVGRDKLLTVISDASQNIRDYLDRDLDVTQYVEHQRGTGRFSLMLDNYPVISLDAVSSLDSLYNSVSYSPSDFYVDTRTAIIEWRDQQHNAFRTDRRWVITYTAGLTEIPGPVKHATALQTVEMLQPFFRGGSNFTQVTLIENLTEQIVDLLERYKRKRMG